MTKTCIVANCKSSERNNNSGEDDVTFFKPPQHEKLFDKWRLNIPYTKGPFTKNSFICQNHFDTNDVIIKYERTLLQNKWIVLCRTMYLKPKAMPIFFGIESIGNKKSSSSVLQNKNKITNQSNNNIPVNKDGKCSDVMDEHTYSLPLMDKNILPKFVENNCGKEKQDDVGKIKIEEIIIDGEEKEIFEEITDPRLPDPLDVKELTESVKANPGDEYILQDVLDEDFVPPIPLTYDNLKLNLTTMELPNKLWHTFITPNEDFISFYTIQLDGYLRRVNVYPDLSVRVSIDRVVVPEHYHAELTSMDALVDFLWIVSSWYLCETLKVAKKYICLGFCEGIAPRYKTLGPIRKKCIACGVRWELDNEEIYKTKQPRKYPERKILSRRTISYLDEKIARLRDACCEVEENVLNGMMAKLDDQQKIPIRECIEAAKRSDFKKGDNDVHDNLKWAYKCMITRYKGSQVYDTLKEKEKLPLPSRNILNKYIGLFI